MTRARLRPTRLLPALAVVLLLALLVALLPCSGDGDEKGDAPRAQEAVSSAKEKAPGAEVTVLDALLRVLGPPRESDAVERFLARAPVERKVAQLFAVGFSGQDRDAPILRNLRRRDWGGLVLQDVNYLSSFQMAAFIEGLRANARIGRDVPPLIAATQEGGERSAFPDLPPRPQGSVASKGVPAVGREARAAGKALRALGVTMTLAPSADVAAEGGPFEKRAFGVDEAFVAEATRAAVQGYLKAKVIPAVGSFPGAGAASQDPDVGTGPVGLSLPELRQRDVRPFRAVARLAPVVRMSNAIYAAFDGVTPATLLPEAVRLLRADLGFRGVVMSADLVGTTGATGGTVPQAALGALKAGADLLYIPGSAEDQEEAYQAVLAAVRTGRISLARLNDSLRRVLQLKRSYGLLPS
ncbi:MAG: glycoside hydrolase family 3 N-terminal domain-containing protein [Solirubrobacteraceae bacterium]